VYNRVNLLHVWFLGIVSGWNRLRIHGEANRPSWEIITIDDHGNRRVSWYDFATSGFMNSGENVMRQGTPLYVWRNAL
jgi:hypothetical protein